MANGERAAVRLPSSSKPVSLEGEGPQVKNFTSEIIFIKGLSQHTAKKNGKDQIEKLAQQYLKKENGNYQLSQQLFLAHPAPIIRATLLYFMANNPESLSQGVSFNGLKKQGPIKLYYYRKGRQFGLSSNNKQELLKLMEIKNFWSINDFNANPS